MMAKTVLLVLLEQYADWEAAYVSSALAMLGQGEFAVKTVALTKETVRSIGGLCTLPDYDVQSVPDDGVALILIGGMSWRMEDAGQITPLVWRYRQQGKLVGGICDAAAFLGTIGLLNDVRHTANDLADLQKWAGPAYTNAAGFIHRQAVSDNHIITANGTAPLEFAKEVLLALHAAPEEKIIEWYNFHKLGCYHVAIPQM